MKCHYICSECGCTYEISRHMMVCAQCSRKQDAAEPLRGVLEVGIEGKFKKDFDIFDFLPVEKEFFPPIPVGNTPLWAPLNLREKTGFAGLYLKDDSLNPTGSLKDRASSHPALPRSPRRLQWRESGRPRRLISKYLSLPQHLRQKGSRHFSTGLTLFLLMVIMTRPMNFQWIIQRSMGS